MPHGRLTGSALCGALLFPLLYSCSPAAADIYHAVAGGETLLSVSRKYQVSPDALRQANNLKDVDESTVLGSMLLRVPGVQDRKNSAAALASLPTATSASALVNSGSAMRPEAVREGFGLGSFRPAATSTTHYGTLGKSVVETVRSGDTWDSIAARYRAAGHDVDTEALRRRNNHVGLPPVGQTVVVPLGQVSIAYEASRTTAAPATALAMGSAPVMAVPISAPAPALRTSLSAAAQTSPSVNTANARKLDGGVYASGEIDLPFAQETSLNAPVYRAPNTVSPPVNRGTLPSRSGFGSLTREAGPGGEVRILNPTEEAKAPPAPQTRTAATQAKNIARVARVSASGARIRRLPQASAATLYQCAVGTQLAILKQDKGWSAILMSDKSTGWVPSRYLSMTSQTVDVSSQIVASSGPGGQVNSFSRTYAGENPMVAQALRWLGTPYRYGGTSRRGIDCSSLVQQAFRACGYSLPRTSAQQATVGLAVDPAQLRSGDRLYFSASGSRVDHTGIYMGQGLFVHASGSGRQVMVSNLFEPRNWNIYVGARR